MMFYARLVESEIFAKARNNREASSSFLFSLLWHQQQRVARNRQV